MRRIVFRSRVRPRAFSLCGLLAIAVAGLSLLPPSGLGAQTRVHDAMRTVPPIGSLVRVTLPPDVRGRRLRREATVLAGSPDSLRLAWRTGDTTSLSVGEMHRLELGLGPHRPVAAAAAWGALGGGVGLAVVAYATSEDGFLFSRGEIAAAAGLAGALGGAAIGAVVGTLRLSERWRTIYRAGDRLGVVVTPVLGHARGVQVRVAF